MSLVELLMKRKKDIEEAGNEPTPTLSKEELQAQLDKDEQERNKRAMKNPPKQEMQ